MSEKTINGIPRSFNDILGCDGEFYSLLENAKVDQLVWKNWNPVDETTKAMYWISEDRKKVVSVIIKEGLIKMKTHQDLDIRELEPATVEDLSEFRDYMDVISESLIDIVQWAEDKL